MISTIYNVTTNYSVNNQASSPLNAIASAARNAATALGLGLGAAAAWSQLVKGPQAINDQVVTMAALINANQTYVDATGKAVTATENFGQAHLQAKGLVDQFIEAAKTSAGSAKDFVSIGIDTLNSFTQSGADLGKSFTPFVKQVLTVSQLLGEDFKQAGMDSMRILSGSAGMDVLLFRSLRAQIFGASKALSAMPIEKATQKFNKMAAPERLALFQKAMGKFATPSAIKAITGTLPAQLSTLSDNVVAVRNAFALAFSNRVVATIQRINEFFERSGKTITATARQWGTVLAGAFDGAVGAVLWIKDHLTQILPIAAAVASVKFGAWGMALSPVAGLLGTLLSPLALVGRYVRYVRRSFGGFLAMGSTPLTAALASLGPPLVIAGALAAAFVGYVAASPARLQAMADAFSPVVAAVDLARESMAITGGYIQGVLTPIMNAAGFAGQTAFGWVTQAIKYATTALALAVAGVQIFAISVRGAVETAVSYFTFLRDTIADVATALSTFSLSAILKNPGSVINVIKGAASGQVEALRSRNTSIDRAIGY